MIKQIENMTPAEINCYDIFTPENTEWVDCEDDQGNHYSELVYTGELSDLVEETHISEDKLQELLDDYAELSLEEIHDMRELERDARNMQYNFNS